MSTPDRKAMLARDQSTLSIRWLDNVFIERLWRFLKYEDAYLDADGREARAGIAAMTLRLDDATASPTCPPRQQQQQTPRVA